MEEMEKAFIYDEVLDHFDRIWTANDLL